ncbi:MAG: thiolase family protein [Candidatus Melainabacteria bacterium]|nr:thiolase family protein [Candidatus Melainabacteria bacterium]MBI3309425.1 thiolase family protein [Candidatus Melainabacteria bacterium]
MLRNQNAYIVDAIRTPFGRGKETGAFAGVHPVDLGGVPVKELLKRNKLKPTDIEDLIYGCASPCAEQGLNIARTIAITALDVTVPGVQLNRMCGSGQQAVHFAYQAVMSGSHDLLIAGGVESMGWVTIGSDGLPLHGKSKPTLPQSLLKNFKANPMGISGELMAEKWGFTRKDLDEFSYCSHIKAANATERGYLKKEIVPVESPTKGLVDKDEGIRKDTTVEKMGTLQPAFKEGGVITAANSSQITDGAAALLVASENALKKYNLKPRARIVDVAVVGTEVELQLTGPIVAIPKVLKRAGMKISDIDLFEINEAFASVVLATQKELKLDPDKINVNGGAIAIGHPLGASGARLLGTLLCELERRNLKRGISSLCIGFGQGIAAIIERV